MYNEQWNRVRLFQNFLNSHFAIKHPIFQNQIHSKLIAIFLVEAKNIRNTYVVTEYELDLVGSIQNFILKFLQVSITSHRVNKIHSDRSLNVFCDWWIKFLLYIWYKLFSRRFVHFLYSKKRIKISKIINYCPNCVVLFCHKFQTIEENIK